MLCVVQAAAEAVVSAQDLVLSCKEALKQAENACRSLIGISGKSKGSV